MSSSPREIDYPSAEEIAEFASANGLTEEDVVRDIVRLVAIHEMTIEKKFLNDDCVLCGGMGLRLYGSSRYTIFDTDTSYRFPDMDAVELQRALDIEVEDLKMSADDTAYWEHRNELTIAQPVEFTETFVNLQTAGKPPHFKFTVARRGLCGPASWLPLTHPYSPMGIEDVAIPVMDLTEQACEKMIGWCAHGLAKHYIDLAWIFQNKSEEIEVEKLIEWTDKKLAAALEREPSNYETLQTRTDMIAPLFSPDTHKAPAGSGDTKIKDLRHVGTAMTWNQAQQAVRNETLPRLVSDFRKLDSAGHTLA